MNFMGLTIAANTMKNAQKSLDVIGQNIANAQVEGYSRQSARQELITPSFKTYSPYVGTMSMGSRITEITRFRDSFLDINYRREMETLGRLDAMYTYLGETAEIFTDTAELGLPKVMNEFWQAWNDAANNPRDIAVRGIVIQKGSSLAQSIRMKANKMKEMSLRLDADITTTVDRINAIARDLASLNDQMVLGAATSTFDSNIILDRRDQLLDELSKLANIQVAGEPGETLMVSIDGAPLVSNKKAFEISVQKDPATNTLHFYSFDGRELTMRGGALKGFIELRNDYIPAYLTELDGIAQGLIDSVNEIHRNGYGLDGSTGLNFFSGTGAGDIQVQITIPETLALGVGRQTSTARMNLDGVLIQPDKTLAEEMIKFAAPLPSAGGTIEITDGVTTTTINWDLNDSITDIMGRFRDAGITATFDYNSQRVILSDLPTTPPVTITDTFGNFLDFTKLNGAPIVGGEPGDGQNGLKIFELATKPLFGVPPTVTINSRYQNLVAKIGFETSVSAGSQSLQKQYMEGLDNRRQQVSGVSVDEELIHLMKFERIFQAGAKLTTVIDEMIQTLLNIVR